MAQRSNIVGELIDEEERIRVDLFRLQRELEKIENIAAAVSGDQCKKT
jgi:hypothetical protein